MESIPLWLTPAMLIPGPGLLILSTSARFGQIDSEFHALLGQAKSSSKLKEHLFARATLFRNALVGLYLSIAAFASASLFGALATIWSKENYLIVISIFCFLGITALVYSALTLIRESISSLNVIKDHCNSIKG